jgi:hypothetical protein
MAANDPKNYDPMGYLLPKNDSNSHLPWDRLHVQPSDGLLAGVGILFTAFYLSILSWFDIRDPFHSMALLGFGQRILAEAC